MIMAYKFINHNVSIRSDNGVIDTDTGEFMGYAPEIEGERYLVGDKYRGSLTKI